MNNKIIGIVIGVLIFGVVVFAGMNSPQMSKPIVKQDGYLGISDDCSSDSDVVNMLIKNGYLTEESNGNSIVAAKGVTLTQTREDSIVLTNEMSGRGDQPMQMTISCSCPSECSASGWCGMGVEDKKATCNGECRGDNCVASCSWR